MLNHKALVPKRKGWMAVFAAVCIAFLGITPGIGLGQSGPGLAYETTVAGYYLASGRGIVVDSQSNAYVFARTVDLGNDILVVKLNPNGDVLWTTFIQGHSHDFATDIALDSANNVYLTGTTDSTDFPVVNALDNTLTGFRDAFIMKLSSVDGSILYSTFLGGDYADEGGGIALNDADEVYVTGVTESTDFPTVDAIQDAINGAPYTYSDAFVTKLSADGGTILYSTYLGGSRNDSAVDIELDAVGNMHIVGNTESEDFPTRNPIQPSYAGEGDVFIATLSADGNVLTFGTYLGGEDWDRVGRSVLDSSGAFYLTGSTRSVFFPTTQGAFQEEFVGAILGCEVPFGGRYNCEDVFVTKVAPGGNGLAYSTYLGGTTVEEANDIAVDSDGAVRVIGYTQSIDFPGAELDGAAAIFVSKLDSTGSNLAYTFATFSSSANAGHGVAVDNSGDVYLTGAVNAPADVYIAKLTETPGSVFFLNRPQPTLAGTVNSLTANWSNQGDTIEFFYASQTGSTTVPGCTNVSLDLKKPRSLGQAVVDGNGEATIEFFVPKSIAGRTLYFQAFEHTSCSASNLVTATFGRSVTGQRSGTEAKTILNQEAAFFEPTPETTALLRNYPNPFNPETWLPYQLKEPAQVKISIYDLRGNLVRSLDIGQRSAGFYGSRGLAAYWDGRDSRGQSVANGTYFYTLQAGEFTATRRMLVVK